MKQIRVLVVEDSLLFRELLVQGLNSDPGITVVATAGNAFEARDAILEHHPDVMTLDVEMPQMSGIEFLRKLMPQYPLPVIVISALSDKVFDALNAGAVDFVAKPAVSGRAQLEEFVTKELPIKVKIASVAKISGRKKLPVVNVTQDIGAVAAKNTAKSRNDMLLAIGASTGGPEAIATVLSGFDTDIPGTVMAQHMPAGFTEMFARRLNNQCKVSVREAKHGDILQPGLVLLAPGGDQQMTVVRAGGNYQVVLKKGPKVNGHCPSVGVLFESVAAAAGKNAVGIILTGMGGDGAEGLKKMRDAGARTIGQDASTCVVYGMPKVAYDIGAVEYQEKLSDIAKRTYSILNKS